MNYNTRYDKYLYERVISEANYIIENKATIRQTARHFNMSKSGISSNIYNILKDININLYNQVKEVLNNNLKERFIRGGNKYKGICKLLNNNKENERKNNTT